MKNEIKEIEKKIISIYGEDSIFLYTFGSMASQKNFKKNSDVDLAIYLKDLPKNFSNDQYKNKLLFEITREVDLVILNKADIIITMQVLQNGKLLLSHNDKLLLNFKICKMSEYIEFKEQRIFLEKKMLE